jgi:drug/metabolite transporter (DMT)-like permease
MDDFNSQPTPYEKALAEITEDLANLRANLLGKLGREVITLETQKNELAEDIQRLQAQRQELEVQVVAEQGQGLQGQGLQGQTAPDMQRQQWIEQLATAIAVHLRAEVNSSNAQSMQRHSDTIESLTMDLDNTLRIVFQSLRRDIESYQNDLDLQMQRMHSQRQQAELLLASLIERIDDRLERAQALEQNGRDRDNPAISSEVQPQIIYVTSAPPPQKAKSSVAGIAPNNWWKGFLLLLAASIVLSLQNVFLRIVFVPSIVLGQFQFGGLVGSNLANPIAVLGLRMLFALPLMWLLASHLFHIDITKDTRSLFKPERRLLFARVGLSALVQFSSFALLYFAIATMKPAIATALFFTFPIASILLNWLIFGDRPTPQKWVTIVMISIGVALICNQFGTAIGRLNTWGVVAALVSGSTFAIYLLISQACYRQINPISFTTINFALILGFSLPFIPLFWSSLSFTTGLLGMGGAIALTTVAGYVLTHFGTKLMGAAPALIFSAIVPILTGILAFALLADSLSLWQIMGISLVSGGVVWLSLQSLNRRPPKRV